MPQARGVIVLQKGRFLLTLTLLSCAALIFSTSVSSLAASSKPLRARSAAPQYYTSLGQKLPSGRRYIGSDRPDWLFERMEEVRTAQGSGPVPDMNLTPSATASEEFYPDAAPQGELNRIVISSNGIDEDGDGQFDPGVTADNFNLWLLRVDGSLVTQLTDMDGDELYPAYDPGGRLVAFSSDVSGTSQIYTVEVLTGTIRQVTSSPGNKYDPTWSPDGLRIAFSGDNAGSRDLFWIPSDGSRLPEPIMETPDNETQPAWAPTAAVGAGQILFTRKGAEGSRIYRVDYTGANLEQVTDGGGNPLSNDTDPTWRHNAQMIAFASDRPVNAADLSTDYNIWTVAPAGETVVDATLRSNLDETDSYDDRFPCFNPGLNPRQPVRLFFTSMRPDDAGAEPDIWRFEVEDPVPPKLEDLPWVDAEDRFVPPGTEVTVHVEVFDQDSGVQQVVAEFKDPDSAEDDSQGIDHKIFSDVLISDEDDEEDFTSVWASEPVGGSGKLEVDCDTVGQAELFDDGDPAHGDETAGDGIFSGMWTTPSSPSDFIIDIHVADQAGNSFEYDDIYGFTTLMFQPSTNVLFVDDYCEGQSFIWNASFENNDLPARYPVESYYTTNPGDSEEADNEAFNTFRGGVSGEARGSRLGEGYDVWRVICRGPIEMNDLIYYLPTTETQLTVPDMTDTRQVLVANRCVVWAAPHTGNVWTAPGSVVDAGTQATLATFLDRGGRMMISGMDIGFALTLDGTVPNTFYNTYLHSTFVRDSSGGECHLVLEDLRLPTAGYPRNINGTDGDPVARHPGWTYHWYPPMTLETGAWEHSNRCYPQDCAVFTVWPDVIQATGDAVVTHDYGPGGTAGLRYQQGENGYRVVYFAWGFEQTHRHYDETTNPTGWGVCKNYRSKLLHNTLCYLRTAGFQGRVLSISDGNQPINDPTPIVRVMRGSTMVAAVPCEEDGRYVVGGLAPGVYTLEAHRPGFEIDHADNEDAHGGFAYPVVDFAISRAEPGAVRGTVTAMATGEPLATVQVCAYEAIQPEPEGGEEEGGDGTGQTAATEPAQNAEENQFERGDLIDCTTTAADGTYQIGNIPAGDAIIVADGADIGYGTAEAHTTIRSGDTVQVDLALNAAPGNIAVTVVDADGNPLADALVEAMSEDTLAASDTTDANGEVVLEVQPGTYNVEATKAGYQRPDPEGVDVAATETSEVALTMQSEPPGSISGLVARDLSGEPVGGMTVEVLSGESVLATTVSTENTQTASDGTPYNYRFDSVPTGQVTIRPDPTGFTVSPPTQIATVESGEETTAVNFSVSSIRTFPKGLQLISLPWDYPATDPAELMGVPANSLQMAAWEPRVGQYALYPSTPADRFRLGSGYWLNLDQPRELSREGLPAEDQFEFDLQAGQSGWNLVGDFFTDPVDFYSLAVRDRAGVVYTMQQAMAGGLVRSPLFAYTLGGYATSAIAEPYIGYWLNVGEDVTIIGNRQTDTLAVGEEATTAAVSKPEGGWLMPLVVSAGRMQDAATWIGCAPAATDDFDPGMDLLKPPAVSMGQMVYAAVQSNAGAQAVDVRSTGDSSRWTVSANGPTGQKVCVRWPDLSSVPNEVRPVLVDTAADREIYMRTVQSYEFTARDDARELQIRLSDGDGALTVTAPAARPVGAGVEISYTLSADAQVQVNVLNIAGRVVQTLADGDVQTAGMQRLSWDGTSARGTRVPNGTYLVVVGARSTDGQQTRAISTVSLGR